MLASVVRYGLRTYQIPQWDEQHYMLLATEFYRLLRHPIWTTPYEMANILPFRQPGYALFIVPWLFIFGLSQSYFFGLLTNGIFYSLAIIGIYILSRQYLSPFASFLASLLFACYGWTLYYVHFAYSETATSSLCIWSLVFLIRSSYFQKRIYSLLFSLYFGLAVLTRWTAIIFIAFPILQSIYYVITKRSLHQRKIFIHIIIICMIIYLLLFYHYFLHFTQVLSYFSAHRVGGPNWQMLSQYEKSFVYSLTFYLRSFSQLGVWFFLLFAIGILLAFIKKSKTKMFAITVIIPWIFFSFFSILKADRFIIPIYPYIAILSASLFDYLKNIRIKTIYVWITILLSIGTFFGSVWGKGPMKSNLKTVTLPVPFFNSITLYITSISHPPNIYKLSGKEIVQYIASDSKNSGISNPNVTVLFSYRPLDEPMYTYNLYHLEKPLSMMYLVGSEIKNPERDTNILYTAIQNADYILLKSGKRIEYYFTPNNYQALEATLLCIDQYFHLEDYFEKKKDIWIYQDSSIVSIYKKTRSIPSETIEKAKQQLIEAL